MRKFVAIFSLVIMALAVLYATADAYMHLSVTGTNVNVRAEPSSRGHIYYKANPGSVFIAEDRLVTSPDGMKWYKIVMSVGNGYVPLAEDPNFGAPSAYISANFTSATRFEPEEVEQIANMLAKAPTEDAQGQVQTIEVSNGREFLEALGSNRIIIMDYNGDYNLSRWDPILNSMSEQAPPYPNLTNEGNPKLVAGVSWSDDPYDGGELVLRGIKNLTIKSALSDGDNAEIIVDPRYAFVMKFLNCSDIVISSVKAGHSEGGYCSGGVFSFENSSRININYTYMYGCGTVGLELRNVDNMKVESSQIYECTESIMMVEGGENIVFDYCAFRDNAGGVSVRGTANLSFTNSSFFRNKTMPVMFAVNGAAISVSDSSFNDNSVEFPIEDSRNVTFTNCKFD
jgi:hypothetical protein